MCAVYKRMLLPTNAKGYGLRFNTVSRGFPPTVFFCTLEGAAVQHVNDDFPRFSDDAYL